MLPITRPVLDSMTWLAPDIRAREARLVAGLMHIWRIEAAPAVKGRAAGE